MSNLGEKASRFLAAGKELVGGVVEAASEKLDEIGGTSAALKDAPLGAPVMTPPGTPAVAGVWRAIPTAPQSIKDLAKMVPIGGQMRHVYDINSNPTRLYAFWAENGIVEAYYEIPRLR